jgi:VanZ family protein
LDVYGKITRQIATILFILGIIGMLLPGRESGPPPMRSLQEISIIGHMLIFFLGAYLLYAFRPDFSARLFHNQFLLLMGAALLASIIIEGLHHIIPGRTGSVRDVVANITGAMIFLSIKNLNHVKRLILLHAPAALITVVLLWPFFRAIADEIAAYRQFPLLAGFETPFEATRFTRGTGTFSISEEYAYTGSKSLRVRFDTQTYSGIAMEYMPRDWQGYSHLKFAVYNPQEKEVTLYTRIHDAHHGKSGPMIHEDRFNRALFIPSEAWTTITIPLKSIKTAPRTREMDMGQIAHIGFFVAQEPEPLTLYIDDIRLKTKPDKEPAI